MEYNIFFTDKRLTFASEVTQKYDLVIDSGADAIAQISKAKVIDFFEKYNSILFLNDSVEEAFNFFMSQFKLATAAGGVVRTPQGECLMIYRNNRWDLPKGHLEEGETIEECAVREVEEETGIKVSQLGDKITQTLHAHKLYGEWEIKTTHWYSMEAEHQETIAQEIEGIKCAKWCTESEVRENLDSTYPTIKSVFAAQSI